MAGYKYKGTEPWVPATAEVDPLVNPRPNVKLKPCGSEAAYSRHLFHGEYPCTACYDAHVAYLAAYRASRPKKPRKQAPCGTYPAAARHQRLKEPLDDACRQARSIYQSELRKRKKAATP